MYTCPMHPEVKSSRTGTCPKCGMDLVKQSSNNYNPLIIIISLIFLVALVFSLKDLMLYSFNIINTISYFMIGFFIVFAGFKLMDLKGFADGYKTYDLLAKKMPVYGYVYPFIELFLGISMILSANDLIIFFEIFIMIFSGLGVVIKLIKKERFQCACLGTFLKVPLTKITLIEDFGMAILGIIILILK